MSVTTETNLLQAVNRVLRDVGERPVTSLSQNPASIKATTYLQDAFTLLQAEHNWEWENLILPASSWVGGTARLGNVQRIYDCYWNTQYGQIILTNVSEPEILRVNPVGFKNDTPNARPRYWAIGSVSGDDFKTVLLRPFPDDTETQAKVTFAIQTYFKPPVNATEPFSMPERFLPILYYKATSDMLIKHLEDTNGYQVAQAEYNKHLNLFRSRENKTPSTINMFRRNQTYPIRSPL